MTPSLEWEVLPTKAKEATSFSEVTAATLDIEPDFLNLSNNFLVSQITFFEQLPAKANEIPLPCVVR